MKYLPHTKTLCMEYAEYVHEEMATEITYWHQRDRKEILVHGNGEKALIEYESLPHKYKAKIIAKYGDVYQYAARQPLLRLVKKDLQARKFYANYELPTGSMLPLANQGHYSRQADWLNLITEIQVDKKAFKEMLNVSVKSIWKSIIELSGTDTIAHKLPRSEKRLREKHIKYTEEGYAGLVEAWRFTNQHARLVTPKIENLLMALYMKRHGRATLIQVVRDYNAFMRGESAPVDLSTGEVFQQDDFLVKGSLYELSAATVKYYLNRKDNRETVDMMKLSKHDWAQKHKPYNRRKPAQFAFSKISMDDYLPPFKTMDGKREVWMYVIFDAASTAIIGVSFGTEKKQALVDEAFKDMCRLCMRKGWGLPLEIEMEKSLNWERRGSDEQPDIFTKGVVFQHLRWAANNAQAKRAERFLGVVKYEQLANEEGFLGRPHGRNENYKLNRDKKEARYMMNELIARLKGYVKAYNNGPISEGSTTTRWQYLCENQNPDVIRKQPQAIMPFIGFRTETSIRRGVVQVQNDWYEVPTNIDWMNATGGIADADAYWVPGASASLSDPTVADNDNNSAPETVYLYQNGKFICEAKLQERYQEAQAERTDKDWAIMGHQSGRQKKYEMMVAEKAGRVAKVDTIITSNTGIQFVNVGYDKLAQEEEEYAEASPNPSKGGEQANAHSFDASTPLSDQIMTGNPWDNIEENAIKSF